ncbi:helix-turn-helix transcriptional regulator [Kitasatospora sp. MAP5-34]|uniref:helix-turn-helix domain-containing protein n=1 Tax=Kitasatospora sp. MAP5-34 TaxID=3035102 RepID=UPI00247729BF|nr:helix-turn-helix transcriptional regulator [Kitasatospora sp. MAP5-34]MDH6580028.1 transcriptional regulator with XRE-family HTH domain [Kitasatospora sp. MAP5-34]
MFGMSIGDLLRELRVAQTLTQAQVAEQLSLSAGRMDGTPTADQYKRWERGKNIPGSFWLGHLSQVLDVPSEILTAEATLTRVDRRAFLSLTAMVATHGKVAASLTASVAGGDAGPLTTVQTTHGTDLVIASLADKGTTRNLSRWMTDGESALLRVNAAGILAKVPGQDQAASVVRVLANDPETQRLYATAVLSRVGALDWAAAAGIVANPRTAGSRASFLAARLAPETLNPRDAGARWCSARLLGDLSPYLGWESPGARV